MASTLSDHRDLRQLRTFGVSEHVLDQYDILGLPENIGNAEDKSELFDAAGTVEILKDLKEQGVRVGGSFELLPETSALERRSDDVWFGTFWILQNTAMPFFVSVLANMLTARGHLLGGRKEAQPGRIHLQLRIRKPDSLAEIDYNGDGATLIAMLRAIESQSKDEK